MYKSDKVTFSMKLYPFNDTSGDFSSDRVRDVGFNNLVAFFQKKSASNGARDAREIRSNYIEMIFVRHRWIQHLICRLRQRRQIIRFPWILCKQIQSTSILNFFSVRFIQDPGKYHVSCSNGLFYNKKTMQLLLRNARIKSKVFLGSLRSEYQSNL